MRVKAVVFPKPNKYELRELNLPDIENDEILVRVKYSGVSVGTERWILSNKCEGLKYPVIPGYQSVGEVIQAGKDVDEYSEGDKVFVPLSRHPQGYHDTACHMSYLICKGYLRAGYNSPLKLELNFKEKEIALLTLATVGYNGVSWKNVVSRGDVVVVIGQGMIGQMAAQHAKIRGARKVITSDFIPKRVELSAKYSADIAVNAKEANLSELVKKEAPEGVNVVIESVGIPENIVESAQLIKYGEKMMLLGAYHGTSEIKWRKIHPRRITIYTTDCYIREEQMATLKLIQEGRLKISPLITHELTINDATKAYDMMLNNPEKMLGVIIKWA